MKHILSLVIICLIISGLYAQQKPQNKYGEIQINWNKLLKEDWFEHDPNGLLVETVKDLKPGKALDVAMGEGRNAIFLAKKGWEVTGFDIADEALDSLQKRAKQLNLSIITVHASVEDFNYGENKWDLVVLCYIDAILQGCITYGDFVAKLARSVRPGGIIVYEFYHRDHFLEVLVNPPASWGCTEDQLIMKFEEHGFKVLRCTASVEKSDWSRNSHKIIKFVAWKR